MIIINNFNNLIGVFILDKVMEGIVDFVVKRDIIFFLDEVYCLLWYFFLVGMMLLLFVILLGYKKIVVIGFMFKVFVFVGICLGWVVLFDSFIIDVVVVVCDYMIISVFKFDDWVVIYVLLLVVQFLLVCRNIEFVVYNFKFVKVFIEKYFFVCCWIEFWVGIIVFIQFRIKGKFIVDIEFCLDLLEKIKVFLVLGLYCFGRGEDFEGYVRMGYVSEILVFEEVLRKLGEYVECFFF